MALTEGSLCGYSIERDAEHSSNDRGCFILHPSPAELLPGQRLRLSWGIFPHTGWEDFQEKLGAYSRYIHVSASRYVLFPGELGEISIQPSFPVKTVLVNGEELLPPYHLSFAPAELGEKTFHISVDGLHTACRLLAHPSADALADARCRFIAEHQQYNGQDAHLDGAYLAYDNEEEHIFYNVTNDYNGGRERVGMGCLIAAYLQGKDLSSPDYNGLGQSLRRYVQYVARELVDTESGEAFNDYRRDNSFLRLYNAPFYATFFVELYLLYGEKDYLTWACRIIRRFYQDGGIGFYPVELPVLALCQALEAAGMEPERQEMERLFRDHGDKLAEIGFHYPPHEVNYEQGIVAPSAHILLQCYLLTREEKYRQAGEAQLQILELFNGRQPDYHLYETAIRHWDGYWFGKRKLFGDTFPHYWSSLTGNCYALYAAITGSRDYAERAEASLRGVLPMVSPEGRGSCAYLYPLTVNGVRGEFYDPYANDQDWGLYFYLRWQRELPEQSREAMSL